MNIESVSFHLITARNARINLLKVYFDLKKTRAFAAS